MSFQVDYAQDLFRWTDDDGSNYLTDQAIYFDMDGTIADLYGVPDWLPKLMACDPSPYAEAEPLVDPDSLWELCAVAAASNYRIGIVSWLSKECPTSYAEDIIDAKLGWCDEFLPVINEIVLAPYGMPKSTTVLVPYNAILVDDEERNRIEWTDPAYNRIAYPTDDINGTLLQLVDHIYAN